MELLKNILSGIMDNFEVEKYDGDNDNYRCKIRCSLSCEGDYDKKCFVISLKNFRRQRKQIGLC